MPNRPHTKVRVKKISRKEAILEVLDELDEGIKFALPLTLLPANVEVGEKLSLKVLDAMSTADATDEAARKLLEAIIN